MEIKKVNIAWDYDKKKNVWKWISPIIETVEAGCSEHMFALNNTHNSVAHRPSFNRSVTLKESDQNGMNEWLSESRRL